MDQAVRISDIDQIFGWQYDEEEQLEDVPTRTYKYGGTGYGEADGNGDSCLAYIQKLFKRNK